MERAVNELKERRTCPGLCHHLSFLKVGCQFFFVSALSEVWLKLREMAIGLILSVLELEFQPC